MARRLAGERPVVLFLDQDGWNCFLLLASALRRAGVRPVCVRLHGAGLLGAGVAWLGFGTVLRADQPRGLAALERLVESGAVVDVHCNEFTLARLDRGSRCARALARVARAGGGPYVLCDKLLVSERLSMAGVTVPEFVRLSAGHDGEAEAARLGFPLVVKRRISGGGAGVAIVEDRVALRTALKRLGEDAGAGAPSPPVFVERYSPGEVVQYAAVIGGNGIEVELCLLVEKSASDPLGPSVAVVTIEDPALRTAGRRAVAALGCRGLVNLEFLRTADGAPLHIDLSARAYGNIGALAGAGVDMIGAYLESLGARPPLPPARARPLGTRLDVFPAPQINRARAVGALRAALESLATIRAYGRAFGVRYLAATALPLLAAVSRRVLRRRGRGTRERVEGSIGAGSIESPPPSDPAPTRALGCRGR